MTKTENKKGAPVPGAAQSQVERLTPITFRFFRGRSGEEIQRKFLALEERLDVDNRSAVLRRCIEAAYTTYLDPGTIVFSNISPEDMDLALKTFRTLAEMGLPDISDALITMCKMTLESVENAREENPTPLLPDPLLSTP